MSIYTSDDFDRDLAAGVSHWPGMYEKYFVTADGGIMSYDAAFTEAHLIVSAIRSGEDAQWEVVSCESGADYGGDLPLLCDHTGNVIIAEDDR